METPNIRINPHTARDGTQLHTLETQRGQRRIFVDQQDLDMLAAYISLWKEN